MKSRTNSSKKAKKQMFESIIVTKAKLYLSKNGF